MLALVAVLVVVGATRSSADAPALGGTALDRGGRSAPSPLAGLRTVQEDPGKRIFLQNCSPCHGQKGQGDGPAAVAFNPRPADYTNPDGIAKMTDDSIMTVITKGRNAMPAFGPVLSDSLLVPLVAYIRKLSRGEG